MRHRRVLRSDPQTGRFFRQIDVHTSQEDSFQIQDNVGSTSVQIQSSDVLDVGFNDPPVDSSGIPADQNESVDIGTYVQSSYRVVFEIDNRLKANSPNAAPLSDISDLCSLCLRERTEHYPFQLRSVTLTQEHVRRQFGCNRSIHLGQSVSLCDLCEMFLQSNKWNFAWLAVICTFLFLPQLFQCNGEYFHSLLPPELRESWEKPAMQVFERHDSISNLFQDFTVKFGHFQKIIGEFKASNVKYLFNDFAFPFVKCPAGCASLINSCSSISFVHVLITGFKNLLVLVPTGKVEGNAERLFSVYFAFGCFRLCPSSRS